MVLERHRWLKKVEKSDSDWKKSKKPEDVGRSLWADGTGPTTQESRGDETTIPKLIVGHTLTTVTTQSKRRRTAPASDQPVADEESKQWKSISIVESLNQFEETMRVCIVLMFAFLALAYAAVEEETGE
ncbi:hypothetical protein LSAT2_004394 [Lamellibrachia satsuma]|nr:hypothetical protein LSAT2_004394 [Lamellibrachia satsuma]